MIVAELSRAARCSIDCSQCAITFRANFAEFPLHGVLGRGRF